MDLPPLRKEISGKVRIWEILSRSPISKKVEVYTRSGFINGKIRETKPKVFKDSSRQTALENAKTYMKSKWTAKRREGYRLSNDKTPIKMTKGKTQVKDFIHPMSAYPIEGNEHKLRFPLYAQAKLDGFRGMVRLKDNDVEIFSRKGLPFPHLRKIKKQLKTFPLLKNNKNIYLDGEIYLHDHPIFDLKKILGRKSLDTPELKNLESKIRFVIFDWFDPNNLEKPFEERWDELKDAFKRWAPTKKQLILLDKTVIVNNIESLMEVRDRYLKEGYEGVVARLPSGEYRPGKRSSSVFRSKEFKRSTFKIINALEGSGDNKGTVVWVLQCLKDKKKSFQARPMGTREERREWFKNKKKYIGRYLEVKYMAIDEESGCVTRFPVGIRFITV